MQVLFEIMVHIKQKRGIGVENPSPRSFSGGMDKGSCVWLSQATHVTYSYVFWHVYMWMSHVTHVLWHVHWNVKHLKKWPGMYEWVTSRMWMSYIAHMKASYHAFEGDRSTHMNVSCHTDEWVMSHKWMIPVAHMNASRPTPQDVI